MIFSTHHYIKPVYKEIKQIQSHEGNDDVFIKIKMNINLSITQQLLTEKERFI